MSRQLPRLDLTETAVNVPQTVLDRSDKAHLNLVSQARFGAPPQITVVYRATVELPNGLQYTAESKLHPDAVAKACRLALEAVYPTQNEN